MPKYLKKEDYFKSPEYVLRKAWDAWKKEQTGLTMYNTQRFGQYFINNHVKSGYRNPELFYETNDEKAFTELMWLSGSEEFYIWLLDEHNTKANQIGGAYHYNAQLQKGL